MCIFLFDLTLPTQFILTLFPSQTYGDPHRMSLWLVPPLVLLPRAIKKIPNASAGMWVKLALTHFGLFVLSNAIAAGIYKGVDKICSGSEAMAEKPTESETVAEAGEEADDTAKPGLMERQSFAYSSGQKDSLATLLDKVDGEEEQNAAMEEAEVDAATLKRRKQMKLIRFWSALSVAFYAGAGAGVIDSTNPALATTSITALTMGMGMNSKVKKVLHPLLFTAFVSAVAVVIVEKIKRHGRRDISAEDWTDLLVEFTPAAGGTPSRDRFMAAGKLFSLLLGPSCTALAFRIFGQQRTLGKALPAVLASSVLTSVFSLFASPAIGRAVGLPAELNGVLAHRSVTSALAIPSAEQCGASPELTVAAVLITGLYGASGSWLLEWLGIGRPGNRLGSDESDPSSSFSARGTVVGTASHSIGTASLLGDSETKAAGIASVSMLTAGIAHAVVCAIPKAPEALRSIAGM
jgi:putative effector of murein hydrolase